MSCDVGEATESLENELCEPPMMATQLTHDDGEFKSCQLCGHEQRLLDELVQPAATVFCQSTSVCRTLTFIWIVTMFIKLEQCFWIKIDVV